MSTQSMEYRVEVKGGNDKWVPFNGTTYTDKVAADARLKEVRNYYLDKTIGIRLASAPVQVWAPVLTAMEEAIETLENALQARDVDLPFDRSLRLVLDAVKEAQK